MKLAAIKALATCGTMKAIEPLYELSTKFAINPSIKREAGRAISEIQKRYGVGERGAVSLSTETTEAGAVSLDRASMGELSIDVQEKARVKHPGKPVKKKPGRKKRQ